jgi:hypothetical protein
VGTYPINQILTSVFSDIWVNLFWCQNDQECVNRSNKHKVFALTVLIFKLVIFSSGNVHDHPELYVDIYNYLFFRCLAKIWAWYHNGQEQERNLDVHCTDKFQCVNVFLRMVWRL